MKSTEIRRRFVEHFAQRGHTVVASASLVPNDPTLLFANAGMVQFKDVFLGTDTRGYSRAVSVQKCMRVSGKHNDLEAVGPSPRHHTFFEMLGNFSFGDYFKREAIAHGWAFVVDVLGIPPERLVLTVHRDDREAFAAWTEDIGIDERRVFRMGDSTNLWAMADVGPCGPTSEIHYDLGPERCTCGLSGCSVGLDNGCDRWLELWNLVFMQYDQHADGRRQPLPRTGVDTGMGLERLAAVMQGVASNYQTDLFTPITECVRAIAGHGPEERVAHGVGYRVLADHARAMTFLVSDGVLPGNEGRNYVLRLIMRRAMRFGRRMGVPSPFLPSLAEVVVETMGDAYPELRARADWIREVATEEENRFQRTLESGMSLLDEVITGVRRRGEALVPGGEVFRLYDTYGFPPDLTQAVAEENGLAIDRSGFEEAMAQQRARARAGGVFRADDLADFYRRLDLPEVEFVGYEELEATAKVLAIVCDGARVDAATSGMSAQVVLHRTPFYADAGGQVGDTGVLRGPEGEASVVGTRSPVAGTIVHDVEVTAGALRAGQAVRAVVDRERRLDVARNHTATHLLHRALERVLGEHAQQRGSLVAPDRLRFDFAHLRALERSELLAIEAMVNEMVRADHPLASSTMDLEAARDQGAKMLFGEKYRDRVRVVSVGAVSKELCGGTHLVSTGQIGLFLVRSEASVGAGLRRIEAVTGRAAEALARRRLDQVDQATATLAAQDPERLQERLEEVLRHGKQLERALEEARAASARDAAAGLGRLAVDVGDVRVLSVRVTAEDSAALREQSNPLQASVRGVVVLGAVLEGRPRIVISVAPELVARGLDAGRLARELGGLLGGGGGGRPSLAEVGGKDPSRLEAALERVPALVGAALGVAPPDAAPPGADSGA